MKTKIVLLFLRPEGEHNVSGHQTLSDDPEDYKWDHFREETLLHVFHTLLHQIYFANKRKPRVNELFWYTHQQILRRYVYIV